MVRPKPTSALIPPPQGDVTHQITVLHEWLNATLYDGFPSRRTTIESWQTHTPFASALVALCQPSIFVELGTHQGDSYCAICEAIQKYALSTQCTAIDSWEGDKHSGEYGENVFKDLKAYHDPLYSRFSRLERAFFDQAVTTFKDNSIDLLHIDGLHTEEAVLHDFETWKAKLSPSAVVLFHDTQIRENGFGVFKVWGKLANQYPCFEFSHGNGLGVLAVGPKAPEAVLRLCALGANSTTQEAAQTFRNTYKALGASVLFESRSQRFLEKIDQLWARVHSAESVNKTSHEQIRLLQEEQAELLKLIDNLWIRVHSAEAMIEPLHQLKLTEPVLGLARMITRLKNRLRYESR